ncbi:hypothetical protein KIL84_016623 [Mauremys mutica]|uniref:Uncharacterized protein n=1 Tax=Mauremys mutica TaxID=74926 RepID=A0A9D4AWL1_9SAUR|nr:hypothetical protein KIL84_016623 [Mauremys mutica]
MMVGSSWSWGSCTVDAGFFPDLLYRHIQTRIRVGKGHWMEHRPQHSRLGDLVSLFLCLHFCTSEGTLSTQVSTVLSTFSVLSDPWSAKLYYSTQTSPAAIYSYCKHGGVPALSVMLLEQDASHGPVCELAC